MIQQFRCRSCGGTYVDQQRDGSLYAHVCGPLPQDDNGVLAERPNKRDENISISRGDRVIGIKAEGEGTECLTNPKLTEPAWIQQVKAKMDRDEESGK